MAWPQVLQIALQSPVLVVLITSVTGLLVGQQVLRAKDEQLNLKDKHLEALRESFAAQLEVKAQEIAAMERWTPGKLMDQVDAMKRFFELRTEQQATEIQELRTKLDEDRDLSTQQRKQLEDQLRVSRDELDTRRAAQHAAEDTSARLARMTAQYAALDGERHGLRATIRELEADRAHTMDQLVQLKEELGRLQERDHSRTELLESERGRVAELHAERRVLESHLRHMDVERHRLEFIQHERDLLRERLRQYEGDAVVENGPPGQANSRRSA